MSKVSQHSFIHSLYKSRGVLLDILKRRGYNVEEYENISFSEISKMEKNKQHEITLFSGGSGNDRFINLIKSLSNIKLNIVINGYDDGKSTGIITKDKPNDTLIKLMRSLYVTDNIFFNIFCINELLYNVLDHQMVPPHRIISEDEKKELFKNYNITDESQLPDINRFDPVARVLGCRPGNIVEIVRPSKTSISAKYYRLCF